MSYLLFCVTVARRAAGELLKIKSLDTSAVDFEAGFQIVNARASECGADDRDEYHIHFACPLVPTHEYEIANEAAIYRLNADELRNICREAIGF